MAIRRRVKNVVHVEVHDAKEAREYLENLCTQVDEDFGVFVIKGEEWTPDELRDELDGMIARAVWNEEDAHGGNADIAFALSALCGVIRSCVVTGDELAYREAMA